MIQYLEMRGGRQQQGIQSPALPTSHRRPTTLEHSAECGEVDLCLSSLTDTPRDGPRGIPPPWSVWGLMRSFPRQQRQGLGQFGADFAGFDARMMLQVFPRVLGAWILWWFHLQSPSTGDIHILEDRHLNVPGSLSTTAETTVSSSEFQYTLKPSPQVKTHPSKPWQPCPSRREVDMSMTSSTPRPAPTAFLTRLPSTRLPSSSLQMTSWACGQL